MLSEERKIVYVARDIERALGIEPSEHYQILTNDVAPGAPLLDTLELLQTPQAAEILSGVDLVVFKNTPQIEALAKKNGWHLLNPSAALAEKIENKITQIEWLGPLAEKYLPPHEISTSKDIKWNKQPLVIQWAHGHTGDGTILVNDEKSLQELQAKFPERLARVSPFLNGPSFTVNVVVAPAKDSTPAKILIGNISYQITGLPPFTENAFSTVGNDWSVTHSLLSDSEIEYIHEMAREIGLRAAKDGWRGLFGLDVIHDTERNKIFLIEINARQPASTTFESTLQKEFRGAGLSGLTTFEAHIAALQGRTELQEKNAAELVIINDGAQIIQRVTKNCSSIKPEIIEKLHSQGLQTLPYNNTVINSDLVRIQSRQGIMLAHGKLNKRGQSIIDALES